MEEQNHVPAPNGGGSRSWIAIVIVVLLVAGGAYAYSRKSANTSKQEQEEVQDIDNDGDEGVMPSQSGSQPAPVVVGTSTIDADGVKTFTLDANNFSFSPNEIRVKKGDKVKIVMNNTGGFHDWVIDEFNARTERVTGPATASVEFVADKAGTFEFYCSVGQHRQMGMKGNLVVEE